MALGAFAEVIEEVDGATAAQLGEFLFISSPLYIFSESCACSQFDLLPLIYFNLGMFKSWAAPPRPL